ncbi:MAG: hypothetical protein WCI64_10425 [Chlorobium sp.]
MRIEEITSGSSLTGLEPSAVATVIVVIPIADGAVRVIYQMPDGTLKERLLGRADEENIAVATTERPWSFDGDGDAFIITVEAKRIDLAFLFDPMMAVHTSNVEPLPHQITAVYEAISQSSLKALLLEAILHGDKPEVHARLSHKIDIALDLDHLKEILNRDALAQESFSPERLFSVKEEMEKAEARRLQPFFVRSFFMKGFESLGGSIFPRESGRFEITHVPAELRERDRLITGRNRRDLAPVLRRYERVCFTKAAVRPVDKPGFAISEFLKKAEINL